MPQAEAQREGKSRFDREALGRAGVQLSSSFVPCWVLPLEVGDRIIMDMQLVISMNIAQVPHKRLRSLRVLGAVGAVGRATGGVASPAGDVLVGASGRRGGGAVGRPTGFWSCMSSPGATGLRIPLGMPGRLGPPGRGDAGR